MLLTPNRTLSVLRNLGIKDAIDPPRYACLRALRGLDRHEWKLPLRDLLQQFQRLRHRAIVERDGVVIASFERPHLRPTSVRKLRREQVLHAAQETGAIRGVVLYRAYHLGQKLKLGGSRIVIQSPHVIPMRIGWGVGNVPSQIVRAHASAPFT